MSTSKNIGWIINEVDTVSEPESTIVSQKGNRVTIEAVLQDADTLNRNGRWYNSKDLFPQLEKGRVKELIDNKSFVGEAGHPMSKDLNRQQTIDPPNIAHNMIKVWTKGNKVMCHTKGTPNDRGQFFNDCILDDMKLAFSLRALGSLEQTSKGAEVKNIKIITYDWVFYPSHKAAYMEKIVSESTGVVDYDGRKFEYNKDSKFFIENVSTDSLLAPVTTESVISYIKSESANVKSVLESFDTLFEHISISKDKNKVEMISNDGAILVVNLETYIQNEIMDLCNKL